MYYAAIIPKLNTFVRIYFLPLSLIKTKLRNISDVEDDMRLTLTNTSTISRLFCTDASSVVPFINTCADVCIRI